MKFDFQGLERGLCRNCPAGKCPYYESIGASLGKFNDQSLFSCLNCKCPMSSHKILLPPGYFSIPLAQYLQRKSIEPNSMSFNSFIAIFLTDLEEKKIDSELYSLWEYLNYGGFNLVSFNKLEINDLLLKLLEKKLLGMSHELDKNQYEILGLLFENIEDFKKAFEDKKNSAKSFLKPKQKNRKNLNEAQMHTEGFTQNQFDSILLKLKAKIQENLKKTCIVAAFSHKNLTDFGTFASFLRTNEVPRDFELYYISKNRKKALIDMQIFFPEAFKLNYLTFLLPPPLMPMEKSLNPVENFNRFLNIQQDKFKDMLHFNGFIHFNEDSGFIPSEDFILKAPQAFGKFMKNPGLFLNFFNNEQGIPMNFCGKFGTCSLMEVSAEMNANVYKFAEPFQNQSLFKTFYPKLASYQRVLVIFRPNVLLSDLDEILINIYRINQFTVIKRDIIKLSEAQAYYLARIEGIPEPSLQSYISFMKNGPIELVLMSNFGALALSKAIAHGGPGKIYKKNPFLQVFSFKKALFFYYLIGSGIRDPT